MAKRASKGRGTRRTGAQRPRSAQEVVPQLEGLEELPAFADLTCSERQREAFARVSAELAAAEGVDVSEYQLGCVVRLDRGYPAILTAQRVLRAEHAQTMAKEALQRPAVGDWVCVRVTADHDTGRVERVLPRESDIARWRGSARGERQTLAANVDLVLVAYALGGRFLDLSRVARSRVIALDCGADAALVLTKADRSTDLAADVTALRAVLGTDVPVVLCAAGMDDDEAHEGLRAQAEGLGVPWGVEAVRALVPAGSCAMVLGESGAGKSTLLNALLGHELLQVGDVRAKDDAGRHTTVARRMVAIPGAGTIVDEPGLRTLPLVGHERGLALAFPEVAAAARGCRFRDCTHEHEPGCGVAAALQAGEVTPERADVYRALAAEMRRNVRELDPDIVL